MKIEMLRKLSLSKESSDIKILFEILKSLDDAALIDVFSQIGRVGKKPSSFFLPVPDVKKHIYDEEFYVKIGELHLGYLHYCIYLDPKDEVLRMNKYFSKLKIYDREGNQIDKIL